MCLFGLHLLRLQNLRLFAYFYHFQVAFCAHLPLTTKIRKGYSAPRSLRKALLPIFRLYEFLKDEGPLMKSETTLYFWPEPDLAGLTRVCQADSKPSSQGGGSCQHKGRRSPDALTGSQRDPGRTETAACSPESAARTQSHF